MIRLEVLSREPQANAATRTPLLFVHGAYVGAWCWEEHFLAWFAERGFPSHAVSLRGHGASSGRERLHGFGLADYAEDLARAAALLDCPPVLLGHSMGALVVQKYLESACAPAAVYLCPVPPFGLVPASMSLALTRPRLFHEINALASGRSASREALAEALFAGPLDGARVERYYGRMQAESRRALFDMSGWGLPLPWRVNRTPALVLGASRDALIPAPMAQSAAMALGAEYRQLDGLGHAVMLEAAWERAAESILGWLEARGL